MKSTLFSIFFVILSCYSFAQTTSDCHKEGGAFISEIGNEGKADYIELTVYGSTANPTAPVNLEGWILDDNNTSKKDIGNQTGHIRLGTCFAAVNPGTLIVIYTPLHHDEIRVKIINDGFRDYQIQTSMNCLVPYLNCPNKKVPDTGYDCVPTIYAPTTQWDLKELIPLYNNADVLQLRNKEGILEHAIYWTAEYEEKDNPKAVSVMNQLAKLPSPYLTVNRYSIHFTAEKDWFNTANYEVNGLFTLGEKNNDSHGKLIEKCKNGTFSTALKATVDVKKQPTSRDDDGVIEVSITDGNPEFSVTISNAKYFRIEYFKAFGTYEIKNIPSGDYKVYVGDASECGQLFDVKVVKALLVCAGNKECKDIGVSGSDYCKYEWKQHADISDVTKSMVHVCPKETTTYTLKVIDKDGNMKELNYTVEVKTVELNPRITLYCGNAKEVKIEGKDPVWKFGGITTKSDVILVQATGIYEVIVTDKEECRVSGKLEVLNCSLNQDIKKYFRAMGFHETQGVVTNRPPALTNGGGAGGNANNQERSVVCNVTNYSKVTSVYLDNEEVKLRQEFEDLCKNGKTNAEQFYISENADFCRFFDEIESDYISGKKTQWAHKFLDGNENILFVNKNFSEEGNWFALTKALLRNHVTIHCPGTIYIENHLGNIFENTYHSWASSNPLVFQNYRSNSILFTGGPRNTKPDGLSDIDYYNNGVFVRTFTGSHWHECKNKNEGGHIYASTDASQIRGHLTNLRIEEELFIRLASAFNNNSSPTATNTLGPQLTLVTPCGVTTGLGLKSTARTLQIGLNNLYSYYRYDSSGRMEVNFYWSDTSPWYHFGFSVPYIPFDPIALQGCN
jgi:hypothetical protein